MKEAESCPRCNRPVEKGQEICHACGANLKQTVLQSGSDEQVVFLPCSFCGRMLPITADTPKTFACPHCQTRLRLWRTSIGISLDKADDVIVPPAAASRQQTRSLIQREAEPSGPQSSQLTIQQLRMQGEQQLQTLLMQIQRRQSEIRMLEQSPKSEQRDRTLVQVRNQLARLDQQYFTLYEELYPSARPGANAGKRKPQQWTSDARMLVLLLVVGFAAALGVFLLPRFDFGQQWRALTHLPGSSQPQPTMPALATEPAASVTPAGSIAGSAPTIAATPPAAQAANSALLKPSDFQVTYAASTNVQPGQTAEVRVTVTNTGTSRADSINLVFSGDLFDNFDLRGVQPIVLRDYLEQDGRHFEFGPLPAGQSIVYTYQLIARTGQSTGNWTLTVYYGQTNRINSYQPAGGATPPAAPSPGPAGLIIDAPAIIGKPVAEIEKQFGKSTNTQNLNAGDSVLPAGGESRTYSSGNYSFYVFYTRDGIAQGLQLIRGLENEHVSLASWQALLQRCGLSVFRAPDRQTSDTYSWSNINGYRLLILATSANGQVWSVQIIKAQ